MARLTIVVPKEWKHETTDPLPAIATGGQIPVQRGDIRCYIVPIQILAMHHNGDGSTSYMLDAQVGRPLPPAEQIRQPIYDLDQRTWFVLENDESTLVSPI